MTYTPLNVRVANLEAGGGGSGPSLSDDNPEAAGSADPGDSSEASRANHVHPAQTTVSGNAGSATVLQTARNIAGVAFNGSANINIPFSGLTGGIDDTQHGNRGNGSLHSVADASNAGFQSAAHFSKVSSLARSLADYPASPHADDEEFEGTLSAWTTGGSQQATAIDPYGTFTTASQWRYSVNAMRPSWLMLQITADGSYFFPIHKSATVGTDFLVWTRVSLNTRASSTQTAQDAGLGLVLCGTSGGAPDTSNMAQLFLMETDSNQKSIQYSTVSGGVAGSNIRHNWSNTLPLDGIYMAIQKVGTALHGWVGSGAGNWLWIGSQTVSNTLDRLALRCANASTSSPGNMIVGVDFIRCYAGKDWLP